MLLKELYENEEFPSVKTPSVGEIAKKHRKSLAEIEKQLKKGIQVEKEHTKDSAKAMEIALDHLNELPDYYTKLAKMEKKDD